MKHFLLFLSLTLFIFSCNTPENQTTAEAATEQAESVVEAEDKVLEALPEPERKPNPATSTTQAVFIPELGKVEVDSETGIPSSEIYLSSPESEDKIFLVKDMGFQDMEDKSNWEAYSIPANADWAFNTWFAGGGYYYYGKQEGRKIRVFRTYIDEGTDSSHDMPYELFRTIDLDRPQGKPDHYICYTSDIGISKDLMIAFSEDGTALYAQYAGQTGKLDLQLESKDMSTEGAHPTSTDRYKEMVNGNHNGTYVLTHSGIWDYIEYYDAGNKLYKFTINHDASTSGAGYRDTPCL